MKTIRITLSMLVFALLLPATASRASEEVSSSEARLEMVKKAAGQQDQLAKTFKAEKKASKFKLFKKGNRVDFSHPVDKWMWFWIFGWAAGLLLSIIAAAVTTGGIYSGSFGAGAVLFTFAWLAWLFGSVCLVVWLVKKFGGA